MIRVLEVLATLKRAGAETLVTSLVAEIDRSRFEPAVVALYDPSPMELKPHSRVWRLGKRPGFDWHMYAKLRHVMREFRPHVVHTHSYVMRYTLPVARCAQVHTVHNLASREVDQVGRLVHRIGFKRGVVPVAVADQVARSFEEEYGFEPETIPNGIDTSRFRVPSARSRWRAENGFSEDDVLIVSVARLDPQKNPGLLVRALPEGCHLVMAGEGSLRSSLEGIERVRLLGVRSDLPQLLSACDAFALSSDWEGHPLALMEAMAAGLPVVATDVGGVREIAGDAGLLVPPRDPDALRAALKEAVARRMELGGKSLMRARRFDVHETVRRYEALFARVAK